MKHFNAFLNMLFEFSFLFLAIYLKVSQFEHLTWPKFRFKSPWENPVFIQSNTEGYCWETQDK